MRSAGGGRRERKIKYPTAIAEEFTTGSKGLHFCIVTTSSTMKTFNTDSVARCAVLVSKQPVSSLHWRQHKDISTANQRRANGSHGQIQRWEVTCYLLLICKDMFEINQKHLYVQQATASNSKQQQATAINLLLISRPDSKMGGHVLSPTVLPRNPTCLKSTKNTSTYSKQQQSTY